MTGGLCTAEQGLRAVLEKMWVGKGHLHVLRCACGHSTRTDCKIVGILGTGRNPGTWAAALSGNGSTDSWALAIPLAELMKREELDQLFAHHFGPVPKVLGT
jgi:hypothetical protein